MASNLQEVLDEAGNTVQHLRDSQLGTYIYPVVPAEFTNWRREQIAWRETAVLFDQSHHMVNFFMSGPGRAQAAVGHRHQQLRELPGRTPRSSSSRPRPTAASSATASCSTWTRTTTSTSAAHPARTGCSSTPRPAATTSRSATTTALPRAPTARPVTREFWRFQIQGPNAWPIIEKLNGGTLEKVRFFHMGEMTIAGSRGAHAAPRHGGRPGSGDCGVRTSSTAGSATRSSRPGPSSASSPCGSRAYSSNTLESGWIPSPLPAIYSSEAERAYREWLPANSYEAINALAGSFVSDDIEDYYLNPWELGYGSFVKFDHDFIGRDALEQIDPDAQRKKVTLAWNDEDLAQAPDDADRPRRHRLPVLRPPERQLRVVELRLGHRRRRQRRRPVAVHRSDGEREARAVAGDGRLPTFRSAPRCRSSGASPTAGRRRRRSQPHEQLAVRAVVSPVPYAITARSEYHGGWRTGLISA